MQWRGCAVAGPGQAVADPRWVLLPGLVLPENVAAQLAAVCVHSGRTRDAVVRQAVEVYVDGYLEGSGSAE
jgi:hypothetical protein